MTYTHHELMIERQTVTISVMKLPQVTQKQLGFTIVELLIVIVIIAILAAITIVAYNGIQARAYDSRTEQGARQFIKAVKLWSIDHGNTLGGNSGATTAISNGICGTGYGSGFVASGIYTCTTEDMLVANGGLPAGFVTKLPYNPYYGSASAGGRYSMMMYKCGATPGLYEVFWTLRSPSQDDTDNLNATLTKCATNTSTRDSWGMRTVELIQL